MPTPTPILLIGAGPLGIEMAIALKRANLQYTHLEANQIGATMQWWAPGTRWFSSNERISIAGVPLETPNQEKASREEYLAYLRSIVLQFQLPIHTYTRVTHIERQPDNTFLVRAKRNINGQLLGEELSWLAQKLILSTGGTEKPNLLHIPGEDLPNVSHYFHDPHTYFNQNLLIVGGRNSAVEAALRCHRAGARVHFSYHRDAIDKDHIKYWLYPEFASLLKSNAIRAHFNTKLAQITPTSALLSTQTGPKELPTDFTLLMTGYLADMSLAQMIGIHLSTDQQLPTFDPDTMQTNIPNAYIIGTAIAGTQKRYRVFLENCHIHVPRVLASLTGHKQHLEQKTYNLPES
ncbi:MAG: NAD(P)-binding domain-containing protein [Phycisphaerae bacterium]